MFKSVVSTLVLSPRNLFHRPRNMTLSHFQFIEHKEVGTEKDLDLLGQDNILSHVTTKKEKCMQIESEFDWRKKWCCKSRWIKYKRSYKHYQNYLEFNIVLGNKEFSSWQPLNPSCQYIIYFDKTYTVLSTVETEFP